MFLISPWVSSWMASWISSWMSSWPEIYKINIFNWICFTWYNFRRWICCIHQAITVYVTIPVVSVTDWVTWHKQKQQYHWAGHSHPHWSVAHRLKKVLSRVQHVYFSSHFWLHDIISPLHWSISERGLVTSPLAGCRSSTGVRASVCQLSVTSDCLSHQADQHQETNAVLLNIFFCSFEIFCWQRRFWEMNSVDAPNASNERPFCNLSVY